MGTQMGTRTTPEPSATGPRAGQPVPPRRRVLVAWLLRVARPVLAPLLGSALCRVADLLAGVALFSLGAWAIARAGLDLAQGRAPAGVWPVVMVMVGLSLLKAALRYGEQFLGHLVAFSSLELLRAEIFRSLIPRSPRVTLTSRSGDLLARATKDVDRIEVFFAHTFAPAVSAAVVPTTVLVVIGATASWSLAATALPFLVAALLLVPRAGFHRSLESSRRVSAHRAHLTHHVTDTLQGMSEVVGYGRSQDRLEQMAEIEGRVARAGRPSAVWASARRAAGQLLLLAAPVAIVWAGAAGAGREAVSVPALAAAAAAVLRLSECVRGVEEFAAALNASFASAERVWEVVHSPIEVADGGRVLAPGPAHEVVWENVTYSYPGVGTTALRQVNARACAGRWTCLVGTSGSGKSTLAHLALRFDDPQDGRVLIDGVDIRELTGESLRRQVGLVSQRTHLFRASIEDNVRLAAPGATHEEVVAACRDAGIHEDIEALEEGYQTLVGERGASLSGGQRQRLSLARALLAAPSVLILDEFTSHLDAELDAAVRRRVRRRLAGATVIEITHRLQWSAQADHVVVLDAGGVLASGSPAELLSTEQGPLRRLMAGRFSAAR